MFGDVLCLQICFGFFHSENAACAFSGPEFISPWPKWVYWRSKMIQEKYTRHLESRAEGGRIEVAMDAMVESHRQVQTAVVAEFNRRVIPMVVSYLDAAHMFWAISCVRIQGHTRFDLLSSRGDRTPECQKGAKIEDQHCTNGNSGNFKFMCQ